MVEIDASDFALGAILFEVGNNDKLHPISYYSHKNFTAEINYEIYDKELLVIIAAFEKWQYFLKGAQHPTTVFPNHKNLEYFMRSCILNRHQA